MAYLIGREGPLKGLILELGEGDEWIIGRDPDEADLVVEESAVSRRHAKITRTPEGFVLENISDTNPVRIEGHELLEPALLKPHASIQIGHTRFEFEESAPPASKASPYDTIFEETPSQEEYAFPIADTSRFLLKVLSGPNAGAEIGLEMGRSYILGKEADACDIAFQDLSVSRTHARLTLSETGELEIEDLGSKNGTAVNGVPITEKKILTPQDIVSLGTTLFLILDREAPQETIYAQIPPEAPEEAIEPSPSVEEEISWKKQKIPSKYLVLAGALASIFLITFVSFFSLFRTSPLEVAAQAPQDQIEKALAKFPSVRFSYTPTSGKLFLVGHVLTTIDEQEMRYQLRELPFIASTENAVVIDELVWKTMNDVLSTQPAFRGVTLHSTAPGQFVANGYVDTAATLALLQDYLSANFPYLDRLDNKVVADDLLNVEVGTLLTMKGFNAIEYQLAGGDLILTGRYSEKNESAYRQTLEQLRRVQGIQSLKDLAIASKPNMAGVDLSSQYQVTGTATFDEQGFSVVVNGKIYTKGQLLDGMTITAIEPHTVLLEKDGLKYKIDYR